MASTIGAIALFIFLATALLVPAASWEYVDCSGFPYPDDPAWKVLEQRGISVASYVPEPMKGRVSVTFHVDGRLIFQEFDKPGKNGRDSERFKKCIKQIYMIDLKGRLFLPFEKVSFTNRVSPVLNISTSCLVPHFTCGEANRSGQGKFYVG